MRILDGSLGSKVLDMRATDFVVPSTYSIKETATKIRALAGPNPISRLTLICHGVGMLAHGDTNPSTGERMRLPNSVYKLACRIYGGYGLDLGKDSLDLTNVVDFSPLKGTFGQSGLIVIFGCAAADTGPTHTVAGSTFTGDGPALMKKLAEVTGVPVVAAIQLQTVIQNWYLGTADRGPFVGSTYLFKPDGSQTLNAASY